MMNYLPKCIFVVVVCINFTLSTFGRDSLKLGLSLNIYKDLSDTYGNGSLLSGELNIHKSWYGASLNFGYFQAHSILTYKVFFEEISKNIEIQFDEISIMQSSAISVSIIPIQKERIQLDLSFGAALNNATSSQFSNVDYSYSLIEDKFIYLYKDYKLVKRTHFGYQVGLNISYYINKKIGLQLSSKIQDLNNGGTFFFVGGGFCFKL